MTRPKTKAIAITLMILVGVCAGWLIWERLGYSDGTATMIQLLRDAHESSNFATNTYDTERRLPYLKSQIVRAHRPEEVLAARFEYATGLLNAGKTEDAIAELNALNNDVSGKVRAVKDELALAYLRLGEEENCLCLHGIESCILPISNNAIHKVTRGSRSAIEVYSSLLEDDPSDAAARWLLNVAAMTLGEHPSSIPQALLIPRTAFDADYDIGRFPDIAPSLGLDVTGMCGGSVMDDLDGDGDIDVIATSWGLGDQLRFFRNNGDGTFSDQTKRAGLSGITGGLNICHGDFNNDGFPDLFVMRGAWLGENGCHPNSLLQNNRDGTFQDVSEAAGVLSFHPTPTASWADFNNDGWLDLFVGNEDYGDGNHPSQLYRNNRDGTFTECSADCGIDIVSFVKGATWADYDNDGLTDLYVSVFHGPNRLYRNLGRGTSPSEWQFEDVAQTAGVQQPLVSFPTWSFDFDNDGWEDILVFGYAAGIEDVAADYLGEKHDGEPPRLYRNKHDGTFEDVTAAMGLSKPLLAMGVNFGDLDNDGFLDFYVGTGDPDFRSLMPNRMFRNSGGTSFQDVTTSGGFGHLQKGHGVSFGDIDADGDQDIYTVIGGAYTGDVFPNALFQNPGHGNHWLTLRLIGSQSNRFAVGARLRVQVQRTSVESGSSLRDIYLTVSTGGSFGSSTLQQEIGLGDATSVNFVEITWPATGKKQVVSDVIMDQTMTIREPGS